MKNHLKSALLFLSLGLSSLALADTCKVILSIETDDNLYPGRGEVKLCTNTANQISKLIIVKPVQNPLVKDPYSSQADERNPIIHITVDQINSARAPIAVMRPSRFGVQVTAALLEVPQTAIDKNLGGEVVLRVLKNKLTESYHRVRLKLIKEGQTWKAYRMVGIQQVPLFNAYFRSGATGISAIDFN